MPSGTISEDEFADLYAATVRDLLAYVRRRTAGDVEDVVAEVYAVAWRRRKKLPDPGMRRAWLFGVARNLLKAAHRDARRIGDLGDALSVGDGAEPPPNDSKVEAVAAAMSRLSANDREVLRLTAWEGLTPAELAVALAIRPATARVRLHRARRALAADPEVRALVERPDAVPASGARD